MSNPLSRAARAVRGLLTSAEYRDLFWYRRWASERRPYRSQKGQDYWVDRTLRHKENGFFLDLAAADGLTFSNTWFLEKHRGWSGVCIEPSPEQFAKLREVRSAQCVDACISDGVGTVQFRVDNGLVGGIVAQDTDNKPGTGGVVVELQTTTLTQLLDDLGAPSYIDYFSLDVEGSEERVIRGLDFARYRFGLLTVERPNSFVDRTLREHGYAPVKRIAEDVFYQSENGR